MACPVIAHKNPYPSTLEPGTNWWWQCGQPNQQPFCDGSHKVTDFTPISLELSEPATHALCGCKHSASKPYCDRNRKALDT